MAEEQRTIHFGKTPITFTVEFRERRHMGITVHPDARVTVAAPVGTPMEEICSRVQRRAPWILKQLDGFRRFRPVATPRQYLNGETHYYLGKQYRLKLLTGDAPSVKLRGAYLEVATPDPKDNGRVRKQVQEWYREHAGVVFERRLEACLEAMRALGVARPRVLVRRIRTRWGSCSRNGTVLLNTDLVKAPVDCIDYVITHELCHLRFHDHTPAFYRLLSRCMPDWARRKARLEAIKL